MCERSAVCHGKPLELRGALAASRLLTTPHLQAARSSRTTFCSWVYVFAMCRHFMQDMLVYRPWPRMAGRYVCEQQRLYQDLCMVQRQVLVALRPPCTQHIACAGALADLSYCSSDFLYCPARAWLPGTPRPLLAPTSCAKVVCRTASGSVGVALQIPLLLCMSRCASGVSCIGVCHAAPAGC